MITARQSRLATELRKLREKAGLSVQEAARSLGIAHTKLSSTESARVGVSPARVRHFACQYACDDPPLIEALVNMATERKRGWWAEFEGQLPAGFLDLAELEHHAWGLRTFESVHVPGLLQTEEHIRAIYSASVPQLPAEQAEARTAFRLSRQVVLSRECPLRFDVVIHEAALRVRVGDRKVARRQLLHVAEQSERPGVSIRIVPFSADGFTHMGNPLLYAEGPVRRLDTVLVDSAHGGSLIDAEAQLGRYRRVLAEVEAAALNPVESRELVHALSREL
ncbi:helix-turn-helix domain-containing protein [Streptomyces sp. NPDC048172]|uniref:helix-turn-helix domain-containing protein n=1 Tax=Streptomyces sp. NPDC048172 TaxID=3365505 RepID=UPI0037124990